MRRPLKLSDVLTAAGLSQLQADVCYFARNNHELLEGLFLAHVDDLLFTRSEVFRQKVITALKPQSTGDLETPASTACYFYGSVNCGWRKQKCRGNSWLAPWARAGGWHHGRRQAWRD